MKKIAIDNIKEEGFRSKAQMRYLLHLMKEHPEKYSWVKDVLRDHGVPDVAGPLHRYWEPPYNVSPETPSYKYTGRSANMFEKLIKFADKLEELGFEQEAVELDDAMFQVLEKHHPKSVANSFWSIHGNELVKADQEERSHILDERFPVFAEKYDLTEEEKVLAQQYLGDKLLGREVD